MSKRKDFWKRYLHKGRAEPEPTDRAGVFKIFFRNQVIETFNSFAVAKTYFKKYSYPGSEWVLKEIKPPKPAMQPAWVKRKIITNTNDVTKVLQSPGGIKEPVKPPSDPLFIETPLNKQKQVFIKVGNWKEGLSYINEA